MFDYACAECGYDDERALQIDHLAGGGKQHRKNMSTNTFYLYVLAHPEEFQLLCANCNQIKRIEMAEHGGKFRMLTREGG
jgi:hypothetical protein